jgi:hypothetical protein
MTTSMRVIIAAISVAVLASPVMAQQSEPHPRASSASIARAQGSVIRNHARQVVVHREPVEGGQIHTDDCTPYIYAQCGYAH